jgi:DNA-binding Lrp family transcriptional regulator
VAPATRSLVQQALSHPHRLLLVELLTVDGPATAAQLAAKTGRSRSSVANQLRRLEECGAVERIAPAADGGRSAATYRAMIRSMVVDTDEWAAFPLAVRRALFEAELGRVGRHVRTALARGGFDRPDVHLSWSPARLDETAYAELAALLDETLFRALAIQAGAADRRERGVPQGEEVVSEFLLVHFERDATDVAEPLVPGSEDGSEAMVTRMHEVSEALGEELPSEAPDWGLVASLAGALYELAQEQLAPP